jgi:hypothetical protein
VRELDIRVHARPVLEGIAAELRDRAAELESLI